jgi:hypothetical protein
LGRYVWMLLPENVSCGCLHILSTQPQLAPCLFHACLSPGPVTHPLLLPACRCCEGANLMAFTASRCPLSTYSGPGALAAADPGAAAVPTADPGAAAVPTAPATPPPSACAMLTGLTSCPVQSGSTGQRDSAARHTHVPRSAVLCCATTCLTL